MIIFNPFPPIDDSEILKLPAPPPPVQSLATNHIAYLYYPCNNVHITVPMYTNITLCCIVYNTVEISYIHIWHMYIFWYSFMHLIQYTWIYYLYYLFWGSLLAYLFLVLLVFFQNWPVLLILNVTFSLTKLNPSCVTHISVSNNSLLRSTWLCLIIYSDFLACAAFLNTLDSLTGNYIFLFSSDKVHVYVHQIWLEIHHYRVPWMMELFQLLVGTYTGSICSSSLQKTLNVLQLQENIFYGSLGMFWKLVDTKGVKVGHHHGQGSDFASDMLLPGAKHPNTTWLCHFPFKAIFCNLFLYIAQN